MKVTPSPEKVITWTTSQVILATVFVVCVFLTFWLLFRLRVVILLLFVAIVLGTAIRPAVEWLRRRGISRATGVIVIYVVIASLVVGFLSLTLPLIADQAAQISQSIPQYYAALRDALVQSDNRLLQNIGLQIPTWFSLFSNTDPSAEEVINQVTLTIFYANLSLKTLLSILAVFLLAYYWTQESNFVIRTLLRLVPLHRSYEIQEFFYSMEEKIGGYIRGQGILCIVVALAAFVLYTLIGLPYALILAMIAGVMELVPIFGPALGAIPAVLVALSTDSDKVIWVLIATGVIQAVENMWLVPRIMKNSMGVNPIIILLSLVAFSSVFGFPGALLALPLAAIIQLIFDRVLRPVDNSTKPFSAQEADVLSLIDESKRLMHIFDETSTGNDESLNEISESDRLEIKAITQELGQVLQQLKTEDETV